MVRFRFEEDETDQITYSGKRKRRNTILLKVGTRSISKTAFLLGLFLVVCQILDGLLTYVGLTLMGVHMEGNSFLRTLMHTYGNAPVLFLSKIVAITLIVVLTLESHRRLWIRFIIAVLILVYLALAVIPWTYFISKRLAMNSVTAES